MKCLVTGGAGFIGSNIVEGLVENGHDVVVLDNFFLGDRKNLSAVIDKIEIVEGSITDPKIVDKCMKDVDFVFHQAAASSSPMFLEKLGEAVYINVNGFINILESARKHDVKRVMYASTSSIYGNKNEPLREDMKVIPPNFYAVSKLMNEHTADVYYREYGLEAIGFRYMSVYGPHEEAKGKFANMVSQFLWKMKKDEQPVIYGDGTQTRDFVFVKDVVAANLLAMEKNRTGHEILNVGTGKATTLNELVALLNKILGKNIEPLYVENKVKNYIFSQQADLTKIKNLLGYKPKYSLEDGIRFLVSQ